MGSKYSVVVCVPYWLHTHKNVPFFKNALKNTIIFKQQVIFISSRAIVKAWPLFGKARHNMYSFVVLLQLHNCTSCMGREPYRTFFACYQTSQIQNRTCIFWFHFYIYTSFLISGFARTRGRHGRCMYPSSPLYVPVTGVIDVISWHVM